MTYASAIILAATTYLAHAQTWTYTEGVEFATVNPASYTYSTFTYQTSLARSYELTVEYDTTADAYDLQYTETINASLSANAQSIIDNGTNSSPADDSIFVKMNVDGVESYFWFADDRMMYQDTANLVNTSSSDYFEYKDGN